jgi:hypothetical protein
MEALGEAAVRYGRTQCWDVVPATYLVFEGGRLVCSCGWNCGSPGAHPATKDWQTRATADPDTIASWWEETPRAGIVLPAGRRFDVIDVPEPAGCLALARLERAGTGTGPVLATASRRLRFLVLPSGREKLPPTLRRLGWNTRDLDLRYLGSGDYVLAPPSAEGTAGGVYWARPPAEDRWSLPSARQLLAEIAYACRRAARSALSLG